MYVPFSHSKQLICITVFKFWPSSSRRCWLLLLLPSFLTPVVALHPAIVSSAAQASIVVPFSLALPSFPPPNLGSTLPVKSYASTVAQERHIGASVPLSGDIDGPGSGPLIRTLCTSCDQTDGGAPADTCPYVARTTMRPNNVFFNTTIPDMTSLVARLRPTSADRTAWTCSYRGWPRIKLFQSFQCHTPYIARPTGPRMTRLKTVRGD
ncbi:hypothetical protein EDB83DRAFT_474860 [Lactarius deliciosus]|nr:hypothetical protein EDB83DRAFT_474860 [Lactarius deliciosus]